MKIMSTIIMCIVITFANTCEAKRMIDVSVSDNLINALVKVESGGDNTKIGKLGEIGILQIRPCIIEDVNRVYKTKYVFSDAKDNRKAKDICRKYLTYWGNHYQKKTGKVATNQILSKIWNGGPNGPNKKTSYVIAALNTYWNKVSAALA